MGLVPGHSPCSFCIRATAAHRVPGHFSARQAQQPLGKVWDGSSPGGNQDGHSTLLHHEGIWSSAFFFYGTMNPGLLPDSAVLFPWAVPLQLSYCSGISIPARCPSISLPSPLCKFLQALSLSWSPCPSPGSTKSTHWHWFLGSDINILLMTAQSLFIHLGNASLIIRRPWAERRDKLLNQSSTNDFYVCFQNCEHHNSLISRFVL